MPHVCRFTVAILTFSEALCLLLWLLLFLLLPIMTSSIIDREGVEDGIAIAAGSGGRLLVLPWWMPSLTAPALLLLSYPLLLLLPWPWTAADDRDLFLRCIILVDVGRGRNQDNPLLSMRGLWVERKRLRVSVFLDPIIDHLRCSPFTASAPMHDGLSHDSPAW